MFKRQIAFHISYKDQKEYMQCIWYNLDSSKGVAIIVAFEIILVKRLEAAACLFALESSVDVRACKYTSA